MRTLFFVLKALNCNFLNWRQRRGRAGLAATGQQQMARFAHEDAAIVDELPRVQEREVPVQMLYPTLAGRVRTIHDRDNILPLDRISLGVRADGFGISSVLLEALRLRLHDFCRAWTARGSARAQGARLRPPSAGPAAPGRPTETDTVCPHQWQHLSRAANRVIGPQSRASTDPQRERRGFPSRG